MVKIAPSILAANSSFLGEEVSKLEQAKADYIHFDVMDGHFVPNITFGPQILRDLKKVTHIPFDVHLMVSEPHKFIPWFASAGADIITFHIEASKNPLDEINLIRQSGCKVGLSLRPGTNISSLIPYLSFIDIILVMSVEPGFGGQEFITQSLQKIADLKNLSSDYHFLIEVDGGVNFNNASDIIRAGADILVSGSSIFKSSSYAEAIKSLKG